MLELVLATAILAVTAFLLFPHGTATKDQSGTDPAPPTLRDKGQNRGTGGTSVSEDGSQLLWGTGPRIYFTPVTWDPSTPVDNYTLGAPTT